MGERREGDGADPRVQDCRRGDPDARRHWRFKMDAFGRYVCRAAGAPIGRRSGWSHWHVVCGTELSSWEPFVHGYDPKLAYYGQVESTGSFTVFSGPS